MKNISKNNFIDIWKKEINKNPSIYSYGEFNMLIYVSGKNLEIIYDLAAYDYAHWNLSLEERNVAELFLKLYKKYYE